MSEHEEQAALIAWCRLNESRWPELRLLHAIPNAGKRSPRQAAWMKAEGLRAGVPDICLPAARWPYHALYIELKVGRNAPTDRQTAMLDDLHAGGYQALVCYGWQEAAEAITEYLTRPRWPDLTAWAAQLVAALNGQL